MKLAEKGSLVTGDDGMAEGLRVGEFSGESSDEELDEKKGVDGEDGGEG